MDSLANYKTLADFCKGLGLNFFGVADIAGVKAEFALSKDVKAKATRAIVIGTRLSAAVLEEIHQEPTRLYSHHYKTANTFLDLCAFRISNLIQDKGFYALPVPASQLLDWKTQTAHLSHKHLGVLAGLGWIGRNNLLVNPAAGAQLRLATVLTDMPLEAGQPIKEDCGQCRACVVLCPSGAIKDNLKDFDHRACFEKLKEFEKSNTVNQYICGVCVNVCRGEKNTKQPE
jgi:epoxyqueuosine reductase